MQLFTIKPQLTQAAVAVDVVVLLCLIALLVFYVKCTIRARHCRIRNRVLLFKQRMDNPQGLSRLELRQRNQARYA